MRKRSRIEYRLRESKERRTQHSMDRGGARLAAPENVRRDYGREYWQRGINHQAW